MTERIQNRLDIVGAMASWVCVAHCLVTPLLVGIIPLVGAQIFLSEPAERVLIGVSVSLALISLLPSYLSQHRKLHSIFLAMAGLSLIILTHLRFEDALVIKATFLLLGAVLISIAHLLNRYLCRVCKAC